MMIRLLGDIWLIENSQLQINIHQEDRNNYIPQLLLANLETPLIEQNIPCANKAGPSLKGSPTELAVFRDLGLNICFSLANNHIMDYGREGLVQTRHFCDRFNILTVGAGNYIQQAEEPIIITKENFRIGILARCETQFGTASINKSGVAALSPRIYQQIQHIKKEVDILILSLHGASEMCPWPSPQWQDLLRSFIDAGVDIVHGHHVHVPQGFEKYNNGLIFYGLGNFLVEPRQWQDRENTLWSLIIDCDLLKDNLSFVLKTTVASLIEDRIIIRNSSKEEFNQHLLYLKKCNQPLHDRLLLTAIWQEVSLRMYYFCYGEWLNFLPKTIKQKDRYNIIKYLKTIKNKIKFQLSNKKNLSNSHSLMLWYVLFACENHSNTITTALGILTREIEDLRTDNTKKIVDEMMPWSKEILTK